jgi:hypothetical protein
MFKKVLSRLFGKSEEPTPAPPSAASAITAKSATKEVTKSKAQLAAEAKAMAQAAKAAGHSRGSTGPVSSPAQPSVAAKKSDPGGKPNALKEWEEASRRRLDRHGKPEELCEIKDGMSEQAIRDHLAMLYRRHNRAASSLDSQLREEAEFMLDAVVRCREKYLKKGA